MAWLLTCIRRWHGQRQAEQDRRWTGMVAEKIRCEAGGPPCSSCRLFDWQGPFMHVDADHPWRGYR